MTISDFNRFSFADQPPMEISFTWKLILAANFAVNSKRSGAVSADLMHMGGFCLQMPILHPTLRSEKFFLVRAARLCSTHSSFAAGTQIGAEPGSDGTKMQHRKVGKAPTWPKLTIHVYSPSCTECVNYCKPTFAITKL